MWMFSATQSAGNRIHIMLNRMTMWKPWRTSKKKHFLGEFLKQPLDEPQKDLWKIFKLLLWETVEKLPNECLGNSLMESLEVFLLKEFLWKSMTVFSEESSERIAKYNQSLVIFSYFFYLKLLGEIAKRIILDISEKKTLAEFQ